MTMKMHRCAQLNCEVSIEESRDHSRVRTWLLALTKELEPAISGTCKEALRLSDPDMQQQSAGTASPQTQPLRYNTVWL